jgi:hypothetical protein
MEDSSKVVDVNGQKVKGVMEKYMAYSMRGGSIEKRIGVPRKGCKA